MKKLYDTSELEAAVFSPDQTADYEIEVEYTNEIPLSLKEKLARLGVSFEKKASGKCSRFMKRFTEILKGG